MKKLLITLTILTAAFAQTTNQTFNYEGGGCGSNFETCMITPAQEVNSPWVATAPVNGGTPGAHYSVITGLAVKVSGYPGFAAIPQHLTSNGTGIFNWFTGTGNGPNDSGSFTLPVACTWDYTPIPNPIIPSNPIREFTEVCTTPVDQFGEMATFTRHWQATPGSRGFWNINRLVNGGLGAGSIVDTSTLVDQSTVAILD